LATVTVGELCNAIEDTLGQATTLQRSQSYDELTEGLHDFPVLQVYPASGNTDAKGQADRRTFRGGVRTGYYVFHADYHACPRSEIGENMNTVVDGIDAMEAILLAQDTKPYLGHEAIKSFHYDWEYVNFEYAGQKTVGVRFRIGVWIF